uniref:murein biosynthesis integral membrane protein MurJ n=1 Tax=Gordonibacter sp. An230 TaxID=1965592 RepID=UPI001EF6522A|nr:murein biosynthesis integral membrane protein MurJ [Gordonibacter sp. An230]
MRANVPDPARTATTPGRLGASHARAADPGSTSEIFVGGRHAGLDRTVIAAAVAQHVVPRPEPPLDPASAKARLKAAPPGETSEICIGGRHAGCDRTTPQRDPFEPSTPEPLTTQARTARSESTGAFFVGGRHAGPDRTERSDSAGFGAGAKPSPTAAPEPENAAAAVGASAALVSVCVMISRITGFARTWAMAFALGSTLLSSSYQVANTLPNQLYELVVGGMLVTAFLPVYLSVKKKLGQRASNEYASNLLTIVVVLLGVVSALCMLFPSAIIYTQSFYSDQAEMATATLLFQFFAVQVVFYGASAVLQGLLNANRDYLWSAIAPVANNVIVIATFALYAFVAPHDPQLALYLIAVGNPLGVFAQLVIQMPALRRNGIRLRPRLNLRDPALRETLSIGAPTVLVMICSFAVVSVQTAASYSFSESGPSVLAYARLWFTLPYAFLAVPITTTMFTELAEMQAEGNTQGVKRGIVSGTNQILFFMVPFALYLMVFAMPLVTLYHAGAFTMESVGAIADYLAVLAVALPFYGVNTYLQKVYSSVRKMGVFAGFNFVAGGVQIGLTMLAASGAIDLPFEAIAVAEAAFYAVADACLFAYLRHHLGAFGLRSTARTLACSLALGGLGAAVGAGVLFALQTWAAPLSGSIPQALAYVAAGGLASLFVTFGLALKLRVPEAAFLANIADKVKGKLGR